MLFIKKQRVRILRIMKFIPTRMSILINWALFEHNFNTICNTKAAPKVTTQSLLETEIFFVHLQKKLIFEIARIQSRSSWAED